jgi:hypothetical protein
MRDAEAQRDPQQKDERTRVTGHEADRERGLAARPSPSRPTESEGGAAPRASLFFTRQGEMRWMLTINCATVRRHGAVDIALAETRFGIKVSLHRYAFFDADASICDVLISGTSLLFAAPTPIRLDGIANCAKLGLGWDGTARDGIRRMQPSPPRRAT